MRSAFWASKYNEVKLANAKLPILLRECEGVPAKLTATYGAARSRHSDQCKRRRDAKEMGVGAPRAAAPAADLRPRARDRNGR